MVLLDGKLLKTDVKGNRYMKKTDFEAILFDLDGTLWDSTEGIKETWNIVLAKHGDVEGLRKSVSIADLEACMGLAMDKIAEKLFPNMTTEFQLQLMDECCELENEYLKEHGGRLYENVMETLEQLKQNYRLMIVSNCQIGYIESFLHAHKCQHLFEDFESFGATSLTKGENIQFIMKRNQISKAIYVGDIINDAIAAKQAGIPFVYAKYGFGDVLEYDYVIDVFEDLLKLF